MDNVVKFLSDYKGIPVKDLAKEIGLRECVLYTHLTNEDCLLFDARLLAGYFGVSIESIARNRVILVKHSNDESFAMTEKEAALMNYTVNAGEVFEVQVVYNSKSEWCSKKYVFCKQEVRA